MPPESVAMVVFRLGSSICALPVANALESMRLQPVTPVDGVPPFIAGVAVIRGERVPVLDLGRLLGMETTPTRLLTVRAGQQTVALAVDAIRGVQQFEQARLGERPALLAADRQPLVRSLALRDRQVYLVLDAARIVAEGQTAA